MVPALARLALFALVFQMAAFDHHAEPLSAAERAEHELHCHGASGGCANGGGDALTMAQSAASLLPAQPSSVRLTSLEDDLAPADALVELTAEPPRILAAS